MLVCVDKWTWLLFLTVTYYQPVQPVAPINKNFLRPNLSMENAVQKFPMVVKLVQKASGSKGTKPVKPSDT
jgi:hypothetical protein